MAKYYNRVHPIAKLVQARDSHTWKSMLSVRDEVESVLWWRLFQGHVSLWWDKWSRLELLRRAFPSAGVSYSHSLLSNFIQDDVLDLMEFDDLLPSNLTADLSRLGQGHRDIPIWRVATNVMFSFSFAKSFLRALGPDSDVLLGRC